MCSRKCDFCAGTPVGVIAQAIRDWLRDSDVARLYIIKPGAPRENAYSESFNSRFRDEPLDRELLTSLREAQVIVGDYRLEYNHRRPHSSLGYLTPAAFAVQKGGGDGAAPPAAPCPRLAGVTGIDRANDARDILAQLRRPRRTDAQIGDGEACHRSYVARD